MKKVILLFFIVTGCVFGQDLKAQSCVNVGYVLYLGTTYVDLSFNIYNSSGQEVLSVDPSSIQNGTLCLPSDCYTIHMYCGNSSGWQDAHLDLAIFGQSQQIFTLDSGYFGVASFGVGTVDCAVTPNMGCTDFSAANFNPAANVDDGSCLYYGCTDSTAWNFNPNSDIDDGSCSHCSSDQGALYPMYICTFDFGEQLNFVVLTSAGDTVFQSPSMSNWQVINTDVCLSPNECYTVVMNNNAGLNGWYGGYFNIGYGMVQASLNDSLSNESFIFGINGFCGLLPGCMSPQASNYNQYATVDDGSCLFMYGCTDVNAVNYDPIAVIDDGSCFTGCSSGNAVQVVCNPDMFVNECAFNITDVSGEVVFGINFGDLTGPTTLNACLSDGCYTLSVFDLYNDGWAFSNPPSGVSVLMNGAEIAPSIAPEFGEANELFGVNSNCSILPPDCSTTVELVPDSLVNALNSVFLYWSEDLNEVQSITWDFGNGDFSNAVYPVYYYDSIGTYTVCATVTFANGCTTSDCITFTMDSNGSYGPGGSLISGFWLNVVGSYPQSVNVLEDQKSRITLFPNPTNDILNVRLTSPGQRNQMSLRIYAMDGREVFQVPNALLSENNSIQIDLDILNSGYYLLVIQNGNKIYHAPFVKE